MTYKAKEWVNQVHDDEGNILRKGTPIMAEDMNKIEITLERLDEDTHTHGNKEIVDNLTQTVLDDSHMHSNKEILDNVSQDLLDKKHTHGNKALIDAIVSDNVHIHNNKQVVDSLEQGHLDNSHTHNNKELIDTIKTENVHEHTNKEVLDGLLQQHITNSHKHSNRVTLDKLTQAHLDTIASNTLTLQDHEARLNTLMGNLSNLKLQVVQNIAQRNLLENKQSIVHVIDASADATVESGWAQYIWQDNEWVKVAEKESIDVEISWSDVTDKPLKFTPIDHTHSIANVTGLQGQLDLKESIEESTSKIATALVSANTYANNLIGNRIIDNRSVVPLPSDYTRNRTAQEFKYATSIGLGGIAGTYVHVFTERAWANNSGGYVRQLAYDGLTTRMWTRFGNQALNTWGDWVELETVVGSQNKVDTHDSNTEKHITPLERTNWNSASTEKHSHSNKEVLDKVKQTDLDSVHTHGNKVVLDKIVQKHLDDIAQSLIKIQALEESSTQHHSHSNKVVIDKITQAMLDNFHAHSNKSALDKVTDGIVNMAHKHDNGSIIDSITQGQLDKIHEHSNKGTLDKLLYTGAKPNVDLALLDELENHTHDYSKISNTPTIPSKISQLTDDSEFVKGNVGRIIISSTQPSNMQENDIWIKVI